MKEKVAEELVLQTFQGAAVLKKGSKDSLAQLTRKVMSKGGTTEAGFKEIAKEKLFPALANVLEAAFERSVELGRN